VSGKKKQRREEEEASRGDLVRILFRRRVGLGAYLIFLGLCVLGGEVGPWWTTYVGEKKIGQTMYGPEFLRYSLEPLNADPDPGDPLAKYRRKRVEAVIVPAHLVTLLCVLAFLIASYNLVADTDIQLPTFLLTLGVTVTACYIGYQVFADNTVLDEVLGQHLRDETLRGARPGRELPRMVFGWGFALFVASALTMFVSSTYLTFVAKRGEGRP
jgi:hypothetical protein